MWRTDENIPGVTRLHSLLQQHSARDCSLVLLLTYTSRVLSLIELSNTTFPNMQR